MPPATGALSMQPETETSKLADPREVTLGGRVGTRLHAVGHAAMEYLGVGSVLLALVVYLSITQTGFLTRFNIQNIFETNAVLLIVAVGLTFVMLTGGFDLSIGGMLALSGVVFAQTLQHDWSLWAAIVVVVLGAGLLGLVTNGLLIGWLGLSFLVVTLGMAAILRAAALIRTNGETVALYDYENGVFTALKEGRVWGVSYQVVVAGAVFVLATLVLRYTGYGRMVYAVGGNRVAARLAGINVTGIRMSVYAIAALLAGLAGVLHTARLQSAPATAGDGVELMAAAAVLIGGTTFMGGRGTMLGTLLGVVFLGVVSNGVTLAEVSPYWTGVITGGVLILAVLVDWLRHRRAM